MNEKLLRLALRRELLMREAEQQRMQLVLIVDTWRAPFAIADQGLAAINFIRKHPIWMFGGGAILLKLLRPSRIGKWFQRGLLAWQIIRKLRS
jgi:YqjK-like protein